VYGAMCDGPKLIKIRAWAALLASFAQSVVSRPLDHALTAAKFAHHPLGAAARHISDLIRAACRAGLRSAAQPPSTTSRRGETKPPIGRSRGSIDLQA